MEVPLLRGKKFQHPFQLLSLRRFSVGSGNELLGWAPNELALELFLELDWMGYERTVFHHKWMFFDSLGQKVIQLSICRTRTFLLRLN